VEHGRETINQNRNNRSFRARQQAWNQHAEESDMATVGKRRRTETQPPLENGDHLDQRTFHQRYQAMPEDLRAELIGGIVHMPSPQKTPHSHVQGIAAHWLGEYVEATPGTETLVHNTQILGHESEPQPDGCLYVLPEYGGRVFVDEDDYLHGPPDLMAEISSSTESIDLHRKKDDYGRAGLAHAAGLLVCPAARQVQRSGPAQ
jgi:Uma2 family endonuclease